MSDNKGHAKPEKSFWSTMPGILSGIAATISAVTGLVIALSSTGYFKANDSTKTDEITSDVAAPLVPPKVLEKQEISDLRNSAKAHYDEKRFDEAVTDYLAVLKKAPGDASVMRYLADSYKSNNKLELATYYVEESLKLEPDNAFAYKVRGNIYLNDKKYSKALPDFKKALEMEPKSAWTLKYIADCYKMMEKYDLAMNYITRALEVDAADDFSYQVRGHIHYLTGRYTLAVSDFEKALQLSPRNSWTLDMLSKARESLRTGQR